jgi:hypothetical protein
MRGFGVDYNYLGEVTVEVGEVLILLANRHQIKEREHTFTYSPFS